MAQRSLVKNAADEEQVASAGARERDRRKEELADLRLVLAQPGGRRVLWRLLERCGVFSPTFDPDAGRAAFLEGHRNVGLWVLADIQEAAPDAFLAMIAESRRRESE